MSKKKPKIADNVIAVNKKARFEYAIEDTLEAGLVLEGWEVKSLRSGRLNLQEGYVLLKGGEAYLFGAGIPPLPSASTHVQAEPIRTRKLLLHGKEIARLLGAVQRDGYSVVPLQMHWKRGRAKVLIGIGKGKKKFDKREDKKQQDWQRQKERLLKHNV
ncbi:SsrA-binding protein [Natronocella acetinitrilica]|uniref:SsrA-binding protein n=1 Tax=Natronocella acetinitrilica TaxID=414046 RepID=A0AAE3G6N3_9GAMM|nr:SsrA-binding protein [Natronocella acetinitrilica]